LTFAHTSVRLGSSDFRYDARYDARQGVDGLPNLSLYRSLLEPLTMSINSHSTKADCPAKPYPTFPLYAHRNGQWAKKIRGQTHFFGLWADPNGALEQYYCERADLEAGRKRKRVDKDYRLTVGDMVNLCLATKQTLVESGEIKARTYEESALS